MTEQPAAAVTREPEIFRPLIPITIGVALGIGIGVAFPGFFRPVLVVGSGLCLYVGWQALRGRSLILPPLVLCILLGYLSIQPWVRPDLPPDHVIHYVDQKKFEIEGTLVSSVSENLGRSRFIIKAAQLKNNLQIYPVRGNIAVSTRGAIPDLQTGDRIWMTGYLRPIRSFCNPGGFDYVRFMALKGVRAGLFAAPETIRRQASSALGVRRIVEDLRREVAAEIESALQGYATDAVAILTALTVGSRHKISPELRTAFNRAGVSHVLAISGLHVGMVAMAAFTLGFWLAVRIPFFHRRGWTRRAAASFTLAPVWAYGLLSGFSPSTQRAVLMTAVFLLSFWVGRRHNWFNTLAAAALIILVLFPPALLSISFQLSFTAVCAIVLGARPATAPDQPAPRSFWRRLPNRAAALVRVSVLAMLGTFPLALVYFDQFSWLGPATNLFVVPVVGILVVPAGLLGIFVLPFSAALAAICWQSAVLCLQPVIWMVTAVSDWPLAAAMTIVPSPWEILLYYLLLVFLLTWNRHPPGLQAGIRMTVLVALITLGAVDAVYWVCRRYHNADLTVTVVDVGQGSAHLLQMPGGYTAVIDGGGYNDNAVFDMGRSVIAPLLRRRKILAIDLVVLSHPHSDHLNGLLYLLDHFAIGEIWSNNEPADTGAYKYWVSTIERRRMTHTALASLGQPRICNGAVLEVLAPPPDFMQRIEDEPWRDLNSNSLVVRVSMGGISFLFCGDIMAAAETDILTRMGAAKLRSTILIIPHHGSRTSSTSSFVNAVHARESIISAGSNERFGFPHADVLERLTATGCRIWRTDLHGAIQIRTDGRQYRIETCRPQSSPETR